MRRSTFARLAKIVVSLGLLVAMLAYAGPAAVVAQIGGMNKGLVALAFGLLFAKTLARAVNWFQLIRTGVPKVTLRSVTYAYFVGGFFGALLPSSLGTDVARSAVVGMRTREPVEGYLATTVLLNVLNLIVISGAALVACALVLASPVAPAATIAASAAVSFAILLGIAPLWVLALRARVPVPAPGQPQTGGWRAAVKRRLAGFVAALVMLPRGLELARVVLVAALSYALRSLGWLALLAAADVQISWAVLLTLGPLIQLGAVLPISVLGFGGYQAISVYLLAQWGVPVEHALAASLVQSGLAVLLNAVGWGVYVAGGRVSAPPLPADGHADEKYSA